MDPLDLVDSKYKIKLRDRWHPTYPGVLEAAMKAGLRELTVKLLQAPTAQNGGMAICEATAVFAAEGGRDRVHTEIGDCDGQNCGTHIAPHRVRMSATRAKGRALRDALGIGIALAEEMTDDQPMGAETAPSGARAVGSAHAAAGRKAGTSAAVAGGAADLPAPGATEGLVADGAVDEERCSHQGCGFELTEREKDGCRRKGFPPLCTRHAADLVTRIAARPAA